MSTWILVQKLSFLLPDPTQRIMRTFLALYDWLITPWGTDFIPFLLFPPDSCVEKFGFAPPSSFSGVWVWGSVEKWTGSEWLIFPKGRARLGIWGSVEASAHAGQVLSGLPHERHGPGAGKGLKASRNISLSNWRELPGRIEFSSFLI